MSDAAHFSRFSAPGFRVPTLDDVIGNLGESVEYDSSERSEVTDAADSQITADVASSKRKSEDAGDVERTVVQLLSSSQRTSGCVFWKYLPGKLAIDPRILRGTGISEIL